MGNSATLEYDVDPAGASAAAVAACISVAPLPTDLFALFGLRVTSDVTSVLGPVKRTLVLDFGPAVTAIAHTVLEANGGRLTAIVVDAAGFDYVALPTIVISPPPVKGSGVQATAIATLGLQSATIANGGAGYSASTFASVIGAMPPPQQGTTRDFLNLASVQQIAVGAQGRNYSAASTVEFQGDVLPGGHPAVGFTTLGPRGQVLKVTITDPGSGYQKAPKVVINDPTGKGSGALVNANMGGGTPATAALTIVAGVITGVFVSSPGTAYNGVPKIVITDPLGLGSGAVILAHMGVGAIQLVNAGRGYTSAAPLLTVIPRFKTFFPDVSDQRAPFWSLIENAIALTCVTPVKSLPPVIA